MKQTICSVLGVIGSAIASFFGGWDAGLATLLIFMGLDYISGLIVAGVFKNSPKTDTGSLESKADRKSTRLNSSHMPKSRMPSSA